jgi:hypothetical protein
MSSATSSGPRLRGPLTLSSSERLRVQGLPLLEHEPDTVDQLIELLAIDRPGRPGRARARAPWP